ncbi:MFS transporter [Dactylosporangium sp. CA-092794]|uniref:MFS transporter n=1 Tax=Dactylosporangium sp. CA-092794 TaxID=3239929 RepID=UPI003D928C93
MFASLANRNFRLYAAGQTASAVGTWMQTVAQSWLVLVLTNSPGMVGLLVAVQMAPVLVFGPYAGAVADRAHKRRMIIVVQAVMGGVALTLGVLTMTGAVTTWHVFVLAALLGSTTAFDSPVRQAFIIEMVGREHLRNAMGLNLVVINVARAVGPAVAGVVIATGGTGLCFVLNAASYLAVVVAMIRLDVSTLQPHEPAPRMRGQALDGVRYAWRTPQIRTPLLMMSAVGCFVFEYPVTLPVLATHDLHGGPDAYGFLTAAMGVGAIAGGLWSAARGSTGTPGLVKLLLGFAATLTAAALVPTLPVALVAIALVGAWGTASITHGVGTVQLAAEPHMRGRVMAMWTVAFLGLTPLGGPLVGLVSARFGGRGGLLLGAATCVVVAVGGVVAVAHGRAAAIVPSVQHLSREEV